MAREVAGRTPDADVRLLSNFPARSDAPSEQRDPRAYRITGDSASHRGDRSQLSRWLAEFWSFRRTVLPFVERDVRLKYRRVLIGIVWAAGQPLAFMIIFTATLGRTAAGGNSGVSYAALSLAALIGWSYLSSAVSFGANALHSDAALVRKVYFPREIPVVGAVLSAFAELGVGLAVFAALGPLLGARLTAAWLLIPVLSLILVVVATAVAISLAALNAYYRDFRYVLPFLLQCWLFASPVAYSVDVIPARWRSLYLWLNPAAGVLEGFRQTLALGAMPAPGLLIPSFVGALVVLLAGYALFKRLEPVFVDRF